MAQRDDFPERIKRYVALRAGYQCSFTGCGQLTVGPSDESPTAVTNIGEAAHICAASPGGRRYVESMTPEERSGIDNAIWLCTKCARLIDRDDVSYTIERLRQMKREHEVACAVRVREASANSLQIHDLVAIGSDVICTDELLGIAASEWSLQLHNFVSGEMHKLISFIEQVDTLPPADRYVLVNALGDGRVLAGVPSLTKASPGYLLRCNVAPSFPRRRAQDLGSQWAVSPKTGDMYVEKGQIARVSGLDSLPQVIRQSLSVQRGEMMFHRDFGARFVEYFEAFRDSPWLDHLIKLEVIRHAAIPYHDAIGNRDYTPLHCIERVRDVQVLAHNATDKWLPIRGDFEVKGVGRWQCDTAVLVPRRSTAATP